jgi:hypothetical protein
MRGALAGWLAAAIVLVWSSPAAVPQEPPPKKDQAAPKVESKRLDGKYDQLKKGMSVEQLVALLGPASTIKTPGDPTIRGADTELRWVDRSTVRVTLKDGKVSTVEASVSPTVVFERVTPENVLKLKPGMAEKDVIDILGGGSASRAGKDGITVVTWAPIVSVSVQLYMGKAGTVKDRYVSSFSPD